MRPRVSRGARETCPAGGEGCMEKPRKLVTGPRILTALVVLAAAVVILLYQRATTKTTIRITKGRLDYPVQWEADVTTSLLATTRHYEFVAGEAVPAEIWRRMLGTVESFREIRCNEKAVSVMVLRYETKVPKEDPKQIQVRWDSDSTINWGFDHCPAGQACKFPDHYFDPRYSKDGKDLCDDPTDVKCWEIKLR